LILKLVPIYIRFPITSRADRREINTTDNTQYENRICHRSKRTFGTNLVLELLRRNYAVKALVRDKKRFIDYTHPHLELVLAIQGRNSLEKGYRIVPWPSTRQPTHPKTPETSGL
jgi:hypothetical protein